VGAPTRPWGDIQSFFQEIKMPRTGLAYHELFLWHDTGNHAGFLFPGFPLQPGLHNENPETKRRLKNLLDVSGLSEKLIDIKPREATEEEIRRFHTADYIKLVRDLSNAYGGEAGELTQVGRGSFEIAKLAAGAVIEAVDAVVTRKCDNAYALVRPPGHHADADKGRGFCIFGNIVIAAKHCLEVLGMEKVAVVDWDVHHGNGTETAFWKDPRVLTISMHQDNWYPQGRGLVCDIGEGAGKGYAINTPLPAGSGVGAYEAAFDRVVIPALLAYKPDIILVASGFDASAFDPLGRMMMHSAGYASLTRKLMTVADELCGGRIVMAHEGGYSPYYVPFCGLAVLETMSGINTGVTDPYLDFAAGMAGQDLQPAQDKLISEVEQASFLIRP
jgi:acetoin utilization deacetylase AcuC-like enzyme